MQRVGRTTFGQWRSVSWTLAVAWITASVAWLLGTFATLDAAYLDLQTRWLQREVPSDIAIVEIDARSLKALGRWPLPRSYHAKLIEELSAAGAERIFLDIDFSAPSSPFEDESLSAALAASNAQVVLPVFWQPTSHGASSLVLTEPLPSIRQHAQLALVNLTPSRDGLVREIADFSHLSSSVPPVWAHYPDQAHSAAQSLRLDFRIASSSFERLSYVDVLRGERKLSRKTVFIGATALELGDIVAVPVHRALPGVVVQAIAVESARAGALRIATSSTVLFLLVPWTLFCCWALWRAKWRRAPFLAIALVGVALGASAVSYPFGNLVLPISPFGVAAIIVLTGSLLSSLGAESLRAWKALVRTRDQDAMLRQVVEKSSDAIITLDMDGKVRTANPAALAVFGTAREQLIGAPLVTFSSEFAQALQTPSGTYEACVQRAEGERLVLEVTWSQLQWDQRIVTTLTLRDVTAQRNREGELRHLARHDALTGLPNRVFLAERLEALLAGQPHDCDAALLMLDLDGFKEVNDTLGHSMGDELLVELGRRLTQLVNDERLVARVGGDEFAILARVQHGEPIEQLAQHLLLLVEEPILIRGIPVSLGTSIGIAKFPEHASGPEALLQRADIALYSAKRKKIGVEFYDPSADTNSPRRLEMLSLLRTAVAKDELSLVFQPKVAMQSGAAIEVEALCRWHSPTLGHVPPGEFIELAEASDVIKPLTQWTIRQALLDCRHWHDRGVELKVAVNLSARHLQDAHLPSWLDALFSSTRTRPQWLELEITESAIMLDPDRASKILLALRELGVTISIDDFGTGYSSLAYLRTLAVDRLKIDRSFILAMDKGHKEQIIVESTIKLAHGLGLLAVAEGIESERQFATLRHLGCDLGQGYLIAKPMPRTELLEWYRGRAPAPAHDGEATAIATTPIPHGLQRYA